MFFPKIEREDSVHIKLSINRTSLTGKKRSSMLLAWLCERTFFHLKINKQLMLELPVLEVYIIVVRKP